MSSKGDLQLELICLTIMLLQFHMKCIVEIKKFQGGVRRDIRGDGVVGGDYHPCPPVLSYAIFFGGGIFRIKWRKRE